MLVLAVSIKQKGRTAIAVRPFDVVSNY